MTAEVTTEKLFADLQTLAHDAEALLKATAGLAGEKVQEVRTRAEESLKQARTRIDAVEEDAMRRAKEIAGAAEGYVRENPWQAVGVAAGIGLLLGLLLSRRS
jgi:ElaB/YqjD/DUF883 family membrane-anchored ribosome-binding protein